MRHARSDYNRIQDPAAVPGLGQAVVNLYDIAEAIRGGATHVGEHDMQQLVELDAKLTALWDGNVDGIEIKATPIGEDEPVFLIRARDTLAPSVVRQYAFINQRNGGDPEMTRAVSQWACEMERWQVENGHKMADAPSDALQR